MQPKPSTKKQNVEPATSQTILTEITSDPEENPSHLSTNRSPEKINEDYSFGDKIGEGAYAVVRKATKKLTG